MSNQTLNKQYTLPNRDAVSAKDDVDRVRGALIAIDADMAAVLAALGGLAAKAPLASPAFTGDPTAPTKAANDRSGRLATTEFVHVRAETEATARAGAIAAESSARATALQAYAPLSSPALTGTPTAPTPAASDNSLRVANTAFVKTAIAALVNGAPGALDALNELAAALGNDPNFATTMTNQLAGKQAASANLNGWSALAPASKQDALGFTPVNKSGDSGLGRMTGGYNSVSMSSNDGTTLGNFVCRASGAGDANLAGMTFYNDAYAIKMGVRHDGTFGIGGWSRAAWSWYSDASGNMVAAGNVSAYSDPGLKENFERIDDPFAILDAINGYTFNWRSGIAHTECKAGKRDYGVNADELAQVMPEAVANSVEIDGVAYKLAAYEKLIPVLIEATKQLRARVAELEAV